MRHQGPGIEWQGGGNMGTHVPNVPLVPFAVVELSPEAIRQAREAAGWSIVEAARQLKQQSGPILPELDSLVRAWKRWESGTTLSRHYRPLVADLLGFDLPDGPRPTPEIPRVFPNQATAAAEIRRGAATAGAIDVLAVRGLGLIALNDSLLRPAIDTAERAEPLRLRVLLSRPGTGAATQRAGEIGEPGSTFTAGIGLAVARLEEISGLDYVTAEVYQYDSLPVWRIIGIDDTLYVSTFSEDWEGHESAVYKVVPSPPGGLHSGFRRSFEDLRRHATRII